MTEAELIARLRMMPTYSGDPKGPHWLPNQAADRIEAMIAERDALFRRATLAEEWRDHDKTRAEAAEAKLATCEKYRDAYDEMGRIGTQAVRDLEAKLAENEVRLGKAVDALGVCAGYDHDCVAKIHIARATLAEIKKPIAEWPEEDGNIMVGAMKGESHE